MLGTKALMAAASSGRRRRTGKVDELTKAISAKVKIKTPLLSKTKIAASGRSSSGRITIFHRGGGSKRLLRKMDMKRNNPSLGIVESIEYDPNRSSRIAAVRWVEGVRPQRQRKPNSLEKFTPARKLVETSTTTVRGLFSLASMPGKVVEQRKMAYLPPGLAASSITAGIPNVPTNVKRFVKGPFSDFGIGSQKTSVKDVFLSAFSASKAKNRGSLASFGGSICFPRIGVAGAKPGFISTRMRDEFGGKNTDSICLVQKWTPQSIVWEHRAKRKAAVSWLSSRRQESLGLAGAAELASR
ncbi:hypothetical protein FEM48_Zijuj11G0077500 [Ziziphus jujuba var. spinosa]|uniref:Large ribosomal subunit protein uL2 RNA-binding domain-containing protein n=1 Tax=Ziziphus jujuba var. spinosa TaxID=714518 RepID=A0A978UHQ0_ZIZJJ|nr:hypothetical protein FEM48_Zijuj11G0077500 [Ziziphus jujuba var. spinosa]